MCTKLLYEVKDKVTSLLSDLIRINTTNLPGNEMPVAKFLAEKLEEDGLRCELLESSPNQGNVITRIKGSERKPSLLLLLHLDTHVGFFQKRQFG